jgi:uncharacterized protein YkwD
MMINNQYFRFINILILCTSFFLSCEKNPSSPDNSNNQPGIEQEVHRLINEHRTGMGLDSLEWNETVAVQCRNHSNYLCTINDVNHDGFNQRMSNLRQTISFSGCAENAAKSRSAQGAVDLWLNSTGHKENIEGNYNLTGVGVVVNTENFYYFTQIFLLYNL